MLRPLTLLAAICVLATACSTGSTGKTEAAAAPAQPLQNTDWQLQKVGNLSADPAAPSASWLRIEQDRVQGNTGCNSLNGSVTIHAADQSISFGPIATTKRYCTETAAIENAMLGAMQEVRKWAISGDQLELLDEGGTRLLVLTVKTATAAGG